MVGALIGKLGVPIQTSIAQSSLSEAYELCQNSGLNEDNPRLLPMDYGVEYKVSPACNYRQTLAQIASTVKYCQVSGWTNFPPIRLTLPLMSGIRRRGAAGGVVRFAGCFRGRSGVWTTEVPGLAPRVYLLLARTSTSKFSSGAPLSRLRF